MASILERATLQEVIFSTDEEKDFPVLVDIAVDANLGSALSLMRKHNILSIPVYGQSGHWLGAGLTEISSNSFKQYIGVISILDIVLFIIQLPEASDPVASTIKLNSISVLSIIGQTMESRSLWVAKPDASLLDSLEPLTKGIHRFLVAVPPTDRSDGDGGEEEVEPISRSSSIVPNPSSTFGLKVYSDNYRMCTQSDIVRFLFERVCCDHEDKQLEEYLKIPVSKLPIWKQKPLYQTYPDVSLLHALQKMTENSILAVPVVAKTSHHLVGTLSVTDLRPILHGSETSLEIISQMANWSVGEFVKECKSGDKYRKSHHGLGHTCHSNDSLKTVLEEVVHHHVHRVWVVEERVVDGKKVDEPVNVLTLSDIIASILTRSVRNES